MTDITPLLNKILCMDALELMAQLPDGSVNAIITDPPYGFEKTKAKWDSNGIPFDIETLLSEAMRVLAFRGVLCLFAAPPFSFHTGITGAKWFRYSWFYEKEKASNFGNCHHQPLRLVEEIQVFSKAVTSPNQFTNPDDIAIYHPPAVKRDRPYIREDKPHHKKLTNPSRSSHVHNAKPGSKLYDNHTPTNIIYASISEDESRGLHPTQKPLSLIEYFVMTYTLPNEIILDPFAGSGTTAVAAATLNRQFIAGDTDAGYCAIARKRLETVTQDMFAVYGGFKVQP